jgi:pyridoxamine 5'-phosphate oxidase
MTALRARLRALPSFPGDLAVLDVASAPDDPLELFLAWLEDAIASGERQPHAMTLATVDDAGSPSLRTLIVKDVDDRGIHFSSSLSSRKAHDLAARPQAGLMFFWRELGRQVEITGTALPLGEEESQADWAQRPGFDGAPNPDWQLWTVQPDRFEFLQARHDRVHTRLEYRRSADGSWRHGALMASEATAEADSTGTTR